MPNPNIHCIIVDDDAANIIFLKSEIEKQFSHIIITHTATTLDDAYAKIMAHPPDLLILDIQLKNHTAFELLQKFNTINFEIIFITAYSHFAIQAIKASALDYLLKPIDIPDLFDAISKFIQKYETKKNSQILLQNMIEIASSKGLNTTQKLALPSLSQTILVPICQIIRAQSQNSYTHFITEKNGTLIVCKTLKFYTEILEPYQFIRVHQQHLVNQQYIHSIIKTDGMTLLLQNNDQIPVSRHKKDEIWQILANLF